MADVEIWRYNKELYDDYQIVLSCVQEAIDWAFPSGDDLMQEASKEVTEAAVAADKDIVEEEVTASTKIVMI